MRLSNQLKNGVEAIFNAVDDLTTQVTYRQTGNTGYNPVTREPVNSTVDYSVKAVLLSFSQKDIERQSALTDEAMIKTGDLTAYIDKRQLSITPDEDDLIVVSGKAYHIVTWQDVEFRGLAYKFLLRAK